MEKNVLNTDLTGKVAVVTGAGGVLCSAFARVLARAGAGYVGEGKYPNDLFAFGNGKPPDLTARHGIHGALDAVVWRHGDKPCRHYLSYPHL